MKAEQKKLPKSQIEIMFELTAEEFMHHTEHALEHLKTHVKVDGFRKGNVPLKMVEETVGVENLLMEAGDHAVKHVYHDYIIENKLEPMGEPEVEITKIAKGSPMEFKVKITVLPEIELPNYQELASKIQGKEVLVDEKEVGEAIDYLQKTRAKFSAEDKPAEKKDFVEIEYSSTEIDNNKLIKDKFTLGEGGLIKDFEDSVLGMKAGEEKTAKVKFPDNATKNDLAGKEITFNIKMISVQKMELPEINDEFAKTLGAFDTLVALKESVKKGIHQEKTEEEKQRKRGEVLDIISEKADFEVPEKLVEYEEQKLFEDLKNNVAQNFKITFPQYLATIKKTEEELKKTFAKEAEKRIKSFLILREIGKKENIEVLDAEMNEELGKALQTYTKEQVDKIDIEQLKEYTKGVVYNEKVFQKLESFSK